MHPDEARQRAAEVAEAERLAAEEAEKAERENDDGSNKGSDDEKEKEEEKPEEEDEQDEEEADPAVNSQGEPIEVVEQEAEQEQVEEKKDLAPPKRRKKFLHHPFTETDYTKRASSQEMQKIKDVEDMVLNFKKEGVKTYVISAGVLYGQGEAIFNSHFKKAWL